MILAILVSNMFIQRRHQSYLWLIKWASAIHNITLIFGRHPKSGAKAADRSVRVVP